MMKMVPYGITDFIAIRTDNYYYVDKTSFIEKLERQPRYLFLIRPRRFGKSLTLAMLECYYDLRYADQFEELFGGLYIGEHPTRLHNKFLTMRFNFSAVNANLDQVESSFAAHCCLRMMEFVRTYIDLLGEEIYEVIRGVEDNPGGLLNAITDYATRKGNLPIYLFIDEYDNFTNTILSTYGTEYYTKATHGEGYIRYFFNVIKAATTGPGSSLQRLFITGVSPVTMDDVTSGFNIGTNITTESMFNSLVGFSKQELAEMLGYYREHGILKEEVEDVIEMIKPNYDNYCFSRYSLDDCMFNSDMTLYFLNSYIQNGRNPEEIVDPNIRTDFNKLAYLVRLDQGLQDNFSVIKRIVDEGEIETSIATHFSALEMTNPDNFKSLLFYFGLLSIKGMGIDGTPILHVPNFVVREQLFNFLINGYMQYNIFSIDTSQMVNLMKKMAFYADWQPLFDYLAEAIRNQSRIREYIEGEAHIKGFLLAYLGLFRFYELHPEYELNKGFADFFFKPSKAVPVMPPYTFLLEVKYCKTGSSDAEVRALANEAKTQLLKYANDEMVAEAKGNGKLKLITLVWRSWELALREDVEVL